MLTRRFTIRLGPTLEGIIEEQRGSTTKTQWIRESIIIRQNLELYIKQLEGQRKRGNVKDSSAVVITTVLRNLKGFKTQAEKFLKT